MKPDLRVYLLDEDNHRFFGEGPYRLLRAVEETGSLRSAALSMDMAYTKALKLLRHAEQAVGAPLTARSAGGRDGGGSRLTPEGKELLAKYEAYRDQCAEANRRIYHQIFSAER